MYKMRHTKKSNASLYLSKEDKVYYVHIYNNKSLKKEVLFKSYFSATSFIDGFKEYR